METTPKQNTPEPDTKIIGTKTAQCPICKQTKQILILKYGLTLCEDCLSVCIGILEHLQNGAPKKSSTSKPRKAHRATSKKPPVRKAAATKNAQASTQN